MKMGTPDLILQFKNRLIFLQKIQKIHATTISNDQPSRTTVSGLITILTDWLQYQNKLGNKKSQIAMVG